MVTVVVLWVAVVVVVFEQNPHALSHHPDFSPHVGQNTVAHTGRAPAHQASSFVLTLRQVLVVVRVLDVVVVIVVERVQ